MTRSSPCSPAYFKRSSADHRSPPRGSLTKTERGRQRRACDVERPESGGQWRPNSLTAGRRILTTSDAISDDRFRNVGRLLLGCREGTAGLAAIVHGAPHCVAGDRADVARLLRRRPEAETDAVAGH